MTQIIPVTPPNYDKARIIERPDGFYWEDRDTAHVFGPFANFLDVIQDIEYNADDSTYEPGETLEEAEDEIGISSWIDPETGGPGEESHHLSDY